MGRLMLSGAAAIVMAAQPAAAAMYFDYNITISSAPHVAGGITSGSVLIRRDSFFPSYQQAVIGQAASCDIGLGACTATFIARPNTQFISDNGQDTFDAIDITFYGATTATYYGSAQLEFANGALGAYGDYPSITGSSRGDATGFLSVSSPTPEPENWALLIAGFAACGSGLRVNRKRVAFRA